MEGHHRYRLKEDPNLLSGWPEKTSRKLLALVVLIIFIGVPILSIALVSVHVGPQTITIEPGSHRAIHVGVYGYGMVDYSVSREGGFENVYFLELDRISYYRFLAGAYPHVQEYESSLPQHMSRGEGGFIWEVYLVFINEGSHTAYIEVEVDSTTYLSLLPAAALMVLIGAVAYRMGRQLDRKARLDMSDPIVTTRRSIRVKAIRTIALISLLAVALFMILDAAIPSGSFMSHLADTLGLAAGLLLATVLAFQVRFRLAKDPAPPRTVLARLAYRLRVSGYRVSETGGGLEVQVSSTSAVHITAKQTPDGTWVRYRAGVTPAGICLLIISMFTILGWPFATALSMFMLYRASAFSGLRVLPRLSPLSVPQPEARADVRTMIIESLSEGKRLSAEAYESERSNYHDFILIMIALGMVTATITALLVYTNIDSGERGMIALGIGVVMVLVISAVSWVLISKRARPKIAEFKAWSARLDAALSREVAGKAPPDGEPSSFELIASSVKEIPKWLNALRRAWAYRYPVVWMLLFILVYVALQAAAMGLILLSQGETTSGLIASGVCAGLVFISVALHRVWKKHLESEMESIQSKWSERSDALASMMEKLLAGE